MSPAEPAPTTSHGIKQSKEPASPRSVDSVARKGGTEPALRGLFDHAGMFPPAQKPLAGALQHAAGFATRLHRPGLVGAHLVIPFAAWPELTQAALARAGFQGDCRVAIVGVPLAQAVDAARAVALHNQRAPARPVVSLEIHADGDVDQAQVKAIVGAAAGIPAYLEPKWPLPQLRAEAVRLCRNLKAGGAGLKVRCAGPTALDRQALAAALVAAADAGIPFKATQGLHHPVPQPGFPHGFLGLLAAFRLRQARGPDFSEVAACLGETDPAAFALQDGIAWRGKGVDAATLARLPAFAIGSCSLEEPDDDLLRAFGPVGGR